MAERSLERKIERELRRLQAECRVPSASYRFQFNQDFTFETARALVPYLEALGVSDLYSSPILRARPGSSHGYDVTDPSELNPELGDRGDFARLSGALRERGMGLLMDVVPNHMGIEGTHNAWWFDVLENGPASRYADYFDIDWDPIKPELRNRVLLPVLGDQYGNVLVGGQFTLLYDRGEFRLGYGPYEFPIAPRSYGLILRAAVTLLLETHDPDDADMQDFQSIVTQLEHLPRRDSVVPEQRDEREREKAVIKRRLSALVEANDAIGAALDQAVRDLNGVPGEPASFDALDDLITDQAYRLAYWRVAGEEINYRRFFDINTMAAVRNELPEVFHATHGLIFDLLSKGDITGLRIDHPDGLWDPCAYFRRLQHQFVVDRLEGEGDLAAVGAIVGERLDDLARIREHVDWPLYVVAEKILTENEPLPHDWAVYGTTGYDFMNIVNGIFVDETNERAFNELYGDFTGIRYRFGELEYSTKKMIMQESLASEINSLAHHLERISERNRHFRDFTLNGLLYAIREFIACLKIYRTYITGLESVSLRDQFFVEQAAVEAERRNPRISRVVFNFLRDTLLLRNLQEFPPDERDDVLRFVMRFQQITGPVMAKSVEDTSFYVYNRLVSINEVGGHPGVFGHGLDTFHEWNARRVREWPRAMISLSTHDTKRSEDVRARLNVLSEIPDEWRAAVERWAEINAGHKQPTGDGPAPDANDEYLLYQTLLGAWPHDSDTLKDDAGWDTFRRRVGQYMAKATKEAKVHTSWTNANEEYDGAMQAFVDALVRPDHVEFLDSFLPLQRRVAYFGQFNSLAQTLLKLTAPGVPDTYRGSEVWDFSLVDPDNRRPVDWDGLQALLAGVRDRSAATGEDRLAYLDELRATSADGRIKLFVVHAALQYRRERVALFATGGYLPLAASGTYADHVCAFARTTSGENAIAVVPRLVAGLAGGEDRSPCGDVWQDTWLDVPFGRREQAVTNVLTGERYRLEQRDGGVGLPLAQVLGRFPVALLSTAAT